jgi:hypothetical protein
LRLKAGPRSRAILTGLLADGSPFSFQRNNLPVSRQDNQDLFTIGALQLTVVPEPTSAALAAFGVAILCASWRVRRPAKSSMRL